MKACRALARSLILVITLAYSTLAFAQRSYVIENRGWEGTGFAGAALGDKLHFPTPVSGGVEPTSRTVDMQIDSGYLFGARVTENLGDYWNAALEYSFANQWLRFTNLSPSIQSLSLEQFVHNLTYNVSVLPFPLTKRFRPYGGAGIG